MRATRSSNGSIQFCIEDMEAGYLYIMGKRSEASMTVERTLEDHLF